MVVRGRWLWIVPLVVGLSTSLAMSGCVTPPSSTRMSSYPMGSDSSTPGQTTCYPQGGVVQASFEFPGQPGQASPPMMQMPNGTFVSGDPSMMAYAGHPDGGHISMGPAPGPVPTELNMVSLPPYTIAPPDILYIDAVRLLPKGPYTISPLDVLAIVVPNALPNQPIAGKYTVAPDGSVSLGFGYGTVRVGGMTLPQAEAAITRLLSQIIRDPQVSIGVDQYRAVQQTRGEHLVRPDGTISLGIYGCVYVAGLNLCQAKQVIEKQLSCYLQDPQVSVDVFAYNSKFYYIVADGGGFGQQVVQLPYTGNETVLTAIGKIGGLPPISSQKAIWVARPSPCCNGCSQILPVDWRAIVQGGRTCTNYQIFPGDRIYIKADPWIAADYHLAKWFAPIERVLGLTLLTGATIETVESIGRNNGTTGTGLIGVVR